MKKSSIIKIWGVVMTVVILAGLLVAQAIPASAANLVWTKQSTPSVIPFNTLTIGTGAGAWMMDVAPDGKTIFAYNNATTTLYKSTNAGATFSTTGIGTGLNSQTLVALAVSSNYASDSLIVAATTTDLYASTNGGTTFSDIATVGSTPNFAPTGSITSVSAGLSYTGGIAIAVGTAGANGSGAGRVSLFGSGNLGGTWTTLAFPNVNPDQVLGVALSPMYSTDATIMMVSANSSGVFMDSKVGNLTVDQLYPAEKIGALTSLDFLASSQASIAFPADFSVGGANSLFVGLNLATGTPLYRATLGIPTASALSGAPSSAIQSLSFKGNLADGYLYAGLAGSGTIWKATGVLSNVATFTPSLKSPAGSDVVVKASPVAADTNIFAITGTDPNSALYVSTDGAGTFNQLSLININNANTTISSFVAVDANNMYMVLTDSAGNTSRIFKTTNGGTSWLGTLWTTAGLNSIYISPSYSTDSALYVTTLTSVYKSTDAGMNFSLIPFLVSNVTAFAPVDASTFYYGTANAVYKSGFVSRPATVAGTVEAINYVDANNMFVGTSAGLVEMSTDGGVTFRPMGTTPFGSIKDVEADVNYATNNTVYATDGTVIKSFVVGTSTDWGNTATVAANALAQGSEGTMYASSDTSGATVYRTVNPGLSVIYPYQAMSALSGAPALATTSSVSVIATGTPTVPNNTIFAVYSVAGSADTVYTAQDTLVTAPAITAPAAKSSQSEPVTVSWTPIPVPPGIRPFTYTATMATDPGFNNTVGLPNGGQTTGSSIYLPSGTLAAGSTYYWKVQVTSPLNSKTSPSSSFSVKLNSLATGVLTLEAPTAGESDVPLKPTFQWAGVNGASGYNFQVADNPVFVNPVENQTNLNTNVWTLTKSLDYSKTYYWRVQAINSATGVNGDWVQGDFTTLAQPVATTTTAVPTQTTTVTITPPIPPITLTVPSTTPATPATPAYIWVIIAIGALLVIVVIVLIARTRRV